MTGQRDALLEGRWRGVRTVDIDGRRIVRTAASKGLSRRRIVPVHILRNSLIPVVTYLAVDFGVLMVGATVTEGIFNVPGVGRTLYQAIIRGEGPTVVSFVTVMVLIYLVFQRWVVKGLTLGGVKG